MTLQWFQDSPISKKILYVLSVPIAFIAIVGTIAIIAIQFISHSAKWVDHTHRALATGDAIVAAAVDMETGMRGFLVAGLDTFLEPYAWGETRLFDGFVNLRETVSDNSGQVERLREAEQTIRDWKTEVADVQIELRRAVGGTTTMDDVIAIVREARGKTYFDKFRSLMSDFRAEEAALLESRSANLQLAKFLANSAIGFFLVVSISTGLWLSQKAGASIASPIRTIIAAMQEVINGTKDVRISGQTRKDEVGDMARATQVFQENAAQIVRHAEADAENARKLEKAAKEATEKAAAIAAKEREDSAFAAKQQIKIAHLQASIRSVIDKAVDGDFSGRVDTDLGDDGLVAQANNVNMLIESVAYGVEATRDTLRRVADGDLTTTMEGRFQGVFKDLQDSTNQMVGALTSLIGEIGGSASKLASSSGELRDTSDTLSKQAEQNAASLEETSAALEQLTTSIKHVSKNVSEASRSSSSASEMAQSSSVIAADAADAMMRISDASKEIAKVVTVINDIAFQINLLALNAGIEAARAGDAGRGFSVVASEVRQLAQRAGEAAKEIDDVITRSDSAVSEGVSKVKNARESLEKISDSVVDVSLGVSQIATAISEQVSGITEINSAISLIDSNTQKQAASFEEVTAAGTLLSQEAQNLKVFTTRFRTIQNNITGQHLTDSAMAVSYRGGSRVRMVEGSLVHKECEWGVI